MPDPTGARTAERAPEDGTSGARPAAPAAPAAAAGSRP